MKLNNLSAGNEFMRIAMNCKGHVELRSSDGDCIDLKSMFSRYLAVDKLLNEHGNELELFCSNREDENQFRKLLNEGKLEA